MFAAIAGVPPDLVDQAHLPTSTSATTTQRDDFYAGLLNDPRMQETIDPARVTEPGTGNLVPSCTSSDRQGVSAAPHRAGRQAVRRERDRPVDLPAGLRSGARRVIEMIGKQLGAVCLSRSLTRDADGLVGCNVYWELPKAGQGATGAPTACGRPAGSSCSIRAPATPSNRTAAARSQGRSARRETGGAARSCPCPRRTRARIFRRAGSTTTSRTR